MLKKILFAIGLFATTSLALYSQGTLTGRVIDEGTNDPIMSANVVVMQNGEQIGKGAATNLDGEFRISPLNGGTYDIQVSYSGYQTTIKAGVIVNATGYSRAGDITIKSGVDLGTLVIVTDRPMIEPGSSSSGTTKTTAEIEKMPAQSVTEIVASSGGVNEKSDGSAGSFRGESSVTYVNNVAKKSEVAVPKEALGEVKVILGGVPASIGEAMGGAQLITLRPPSNKFIGMVGYETSEPFDTRGKHKVSFFLTGPILKKKTANNADRTVIGFRLSGYDTYTSDPLRRTSSRYYWMAKEDVVDRLSKNPLVYDSKTGAVNYAASYLTKNDFERVGRKPNLWNNGLDLDGELNFQLSTNSTLKITGSYSNSIGVPTSTENAWYNMYLNNANNNRVANNSFGLVLDYTQKFLSDNTNKSSLIRDIIFNVVGSYTRQYGESYNPEHGDNVFRYGHVGTFVTHRQRSYTLDRMVINGVDQWVYRQQAGLLDYEVDYTPSTYNPGLSAYTSQLYYGDDFAELRSMYAGTANAYNRNYDNIRLFRGLVNGDTPSDIYNFNINNFGVGNSTYSKSETQYIYAAAKVTANIGDEVYPHSLEIGFNYDQAIHRGYSLNATALWTIMKQNVNVHFINALDMNNPMIDESGATPVVSYNFLYNADQQSYFDRSIRQALGLPIDGTDIIDIDSYDPDKFSLGMFEPDELFNAGSNIVSYYGYDHTGEKITGKKSLQDFFSNKSRTLGAWQPIYMAGYVQDQFQVRNLIFNIGVRVTRFDANQMVLKDPYLLWNSYNVGDFRNNGYGDMVNGKMGDNYIVYVDNLKNDPTMSSVEIKGYRNGNTWYDASGTEISDPYTSIAGSEAKPIPYRKGTLGSNGFPVDDKGNITANADAFKDYEPEIVVEPRIAFSFPATDMSIFKASYDVVARRPNDGVWQANYMNYLPDFFNKIAANQSVISNPDLKSEKITNYELGFEQALSKTSKFGISAFYKQTRDLINLVQYVGTDPAGIYYTYGNQDFRTIKGATFEYILRYSKNFTFNINYTLQYAEGTVGLPMTTILGLIRAGYPNIKLMFPTGDDHRHEIKFDVTFGYSGGKDYNGPTTSKKVVGKDGEDMVKSIRWFQNAGVSLHGVLQSGSPYTRLFSNTQSTIVGSFNGSRLPWWYRVDLYIYKGFDIKVAKKTTNLQVYCLVRNLLNSKSITGVFGVTGDPDDDGYLTDPETQTVINSQASAASYRAYYSMTLNDRYFNYIAPTTIDLGVKYSF
ncbi:MAG: TonB-dependent receptor family protein [Bacteroidales bacterium]|jgi:outer membrane receptor protein involved in Fe transport|nr:TonB-dependent receptor family protein [Bacteroidales bacterium]